jgi:hypothetical protein
MKGNNSAQENENSFKNFLESGEFLQLLFEAIKPQQPKKEEPKPKEPSNKFFIRINIYPRRESLLRRLIIRLTKKSRNA